MLCQILLPQQFKDQKSNLCSQVEFVSIGQAQVGKDIPRAFLEPYFQSVSLPSKECQRVKLALGVDNYQEDQ